MSNGEFEPSEMDKLRMALGEKGELPALSPAERTTFEIDVEAFERGMTPQEILAERMNEAIKGDKKDD